MAVNIVIKMLTRVLAKTQNARRTFSSQTESYGVYLWSRMPRLSAKSGSMTEKLKLPHGLPKRIECFDDLGVQKLRIGLRHSAVICKDGSLWTFGNGNWGVLGHGTEENIRFDKPRRVEAFVNHGTRIVDVAMGEYHTVALDDKGQLFTWGYGGKAGYFSWMVSQQVGALGHGDMTPHFVPKKVAFFAEHGLKVKSISAGNYHCAVTCDDGNLYVWGRGAYGVLGCETNGMALVPTLNEEFKYIFEEEEKVSKQKLAFKHISAADDYTGALLNDGSVYVWGKNDRGQMGIGSGNGFDMIESESLPQMLNLAQNLPAGELKEGETVSAKAFTTGMNTMMLQDTQGRIYITGRKIDYTPRFVKLNREVLPHDANIRLACGQQHYAVLDLDNQNLFAFGKIIKEKAEDETDGFKMFHCADIFEQGHVEDIQMKYEMFGALVKH